MYPSSAGLTTTQPMQGSAGLTFIPSPREAPMRSSAVLSLLLILPAVTSAQAAASLRPVHGDTLISTMDPAGRFIVGAPFRSAGGQVIDILRVAGAEQQFFIDAAPDSTIRRFYWIQFEHYYPDNTHAYDYSVFDLHPVTIGRLAFQGDVRVSDHYFTMDQRPGSDSKAAENFLRAKGYKLGNTFVTLRLFHLPDATRRKELMIIYGEAVADSASSGRTQAEITAHAQAGLRIP